MRNEMDIAIPINLYGFGLGYEAWVNFPRSWLKPSFFWNFFIIS